MPQPALYVAITSHGFGHATRTAAVVAEVKRLCPEIFVAIATTAPRWLLDSYLRTDFVHRHVVLDVGVVQSDSLGMDQAATLEKLRRLRDQQERLVANEADFIRQNRIGLVLADMPPLATSIARAVDLPCWISSNFGWDFIYRPWGGEFVEMADWIAEQFGHCDRLFRLPFHEPMSAFPAITDVGLTGGSPHFPLADLRSKFNLTAPPERTVIMTFGGLGIDQIPYHNLAKFPDWQFITFDRNAPDLPNLCRVHDHDYRPVDFMPLCSRVLSKPGFSTFAEACRQDVPIVSVTREGFAEAPVLLNGVQDLHPHQILSPAEFFQSDWEFLHQPPNPPRTAGQLDKDGNQTIARAVVEYLYGGNGF
ncbi:MAG: glycosyl transferase [Elainella sp.]